MILPIVVFVLIGVVILFALLSFKLSVRAVQAAENAHERSNAYNKDLLDRLMAMDFNTYKAYNLERDLDTGFTEHLPPEELAVGGDRAGFGGRLGLAAMRDEDLLKGDDAA